MVVSDLPSLQDLQWLHLSREGGVAVMPGLRRPCSIQLDECPEPLRETLRGLLDETLPCAVAPEEGGRGDRRYFLLELVFAGQDAPLRLCVPEEAAPAALVQLWRSGGAGT